MDAVESAYQKQNLDMQEIVKTDNCGRTPESGQQGHEARIIQFERHANLKYKYGNRHFWCRGYYVDTVGKNAKKIQEYIANQLQSDLEYDQMTLKEYIDPFTGEPVKHNK